MMVAPKKHYIIANKTEDGAVEKKKRFIIDGCLDRRLRLVKWSICESGAMSVPSPVPWHCRARKLLCWSGV